MCYLQITKLSTHDIIFDFASCEFNLLLKLVYLQLSSN